MRGVKEMTYVPVRFRTFKKMRQLMRTNTAAGNRFIIKEDGTLWHHMPGMRHLKTKKSKRMIERLKKPRRVMPSDLHRLNNLMQYSPPQHKVSDYIMRKFNEARQYDHMGLSDYKTGFTVGGCA